MEEREIGGWESERESNGKRRTEREKVCVCEREGRGKTERR